MHADYYRGDVFVVAVSRQHFFEPSNLNVIETPRAGIIQVNEIHPMPGPVVVGLDGAGRLFASALRCFLSRSVSIHLAKVAV